MRTLAPCAAHAHRNPSDDLINDHSDRFGVAVHGTAFSEREVRHHGD